MSTIKQDVGLAEQYGEGNAHVAVLMRYRTAIERTGYDSNAGQILLDAVRYAQRLKKEKDREEVALWSQEVVGKIISKTNLVAIIGQEIAKLQTGGKENAASA